jgi:hypothetical protein
VIDLSAGVFRPIASAAVWLNQLRRRLKVLVHRAYFTSPVMRDRAPGEQLFIKVTNTSPKREVEATHVWIATDPQIPVLNPSRPLPKRLKLDETYETWIPLADLPDVPNLERLVRVRLSSGKTVKGRKHKKVPQAGAVAGRDEVRLSELGGPPVTGFGELPPELGTQGAEPPPDP